MKTTKPAVQPETVDEITEQERETLKKCETTIKKGISNFLTTGEALLTIRNQKLYQVDGFKTFEAYCNERWGITRQHASNLILAFRTEQELSTVVDKVNTEPLLKSENLSRRFKKLPDDEQKRIMSALKLGSKIEDEIKKSEQLVSGVTPSKPHWDKFVRAVNTIQKILEQVENDESFINRLEDIVKTYHKESLKALPVVVQEDTFDGMLAA